VAFEKTLPAVPVQLILVDGGMSGQIQVPYTAGFKTKQRVFIYSNTQPSKVELEVKQVVDSQNIILGPKSTSLKDTTNLTIYKASEGAAIYADAQDRQAIPPDMYSRAVYEEAPTVAIRTIPVTSLGQVINQMWDGVVPQEWDDVHLTRNSEGDVTEAQFFLRSALITHLELDYDSDEDVIRVRDLLRVP
jgi:hypothetical protein